MGNNINSTFTKNMMSTSSSSSSSSSSWSNARQDSVDLLHWTELDTHHFIRDEALGALRQISAKPTEAQIRLFKNKLCSLIVWTTTASSLG